MKLKWLRGESLNPFENLLWKCIAKGYPDHKNRVSGVFVIPLACSEIQALEGISNALFGFLVCWLAHDNHGTRLFLEISVRAVGKIAFESRASIIKLSDFGKNEVFHLNDPCLTQIASGYHNGLAPVYSGVGIGTPQIRRRTKSPILACGFFCARITPFMVGCSGGTCARRSCVAVVPTRAVRHPIEIGTSCVAAFTPNTQEAFMSSSAQITPEIRLIDGKPVTTSRAIAKLFERDHKQVLRKIRDLDCSAQFLTAHFCAVKYHHRGNDHPEYQITKDGFVFLAMGFTGKKAAQFKEAYITAFNEMERKLHPEPSTLPATIDAHDQYRLLNQMVSNMNLSGNPVVIPYLDLVDMARAQDALKAALDQAGKMSELLELRLDHVRALSGCQLGR